FQVTGVQTCALPTEERFRREARAAQKLAHPNIIEIFDQGDLEDGSLYLVMELLEGETLAERIAQGKPDLRDALPIGVQIARALEIGRASCRGGLGCW